MTVLSLVREATQTYTKHDQLFKELIHHFFEEFLEAFFPDVHAYLDFATIKPLSEEVFSDLHDGDARRLDIVVEAKLKKSDAVLIIHVEPQSYQQSNFHERMFLYFNMLYNRYRKPIVPIAVFSYEEDWEYDQYTMAFPFHHVLTFNYRTLHLRKKDWRDYIQSDNPAAAALLSKMGYSEEEKVEVKKEFLRMLVRMKLDPAKERLIYGFFESYLTLNEEEEEELMEEIKRSDDAEKILELPISYEEKGKEIGKKEVAIEMLEEGFSLDLISRITGLEKDVIEALKEDL
ncbi:RpnC/YadD family protein [Gracilibacillus timonensis]|uniref:transposase n=1 Tax=Gracilibacillus timonensis TaxID=1816696 RepID=UPI0008256756|nr:transposase [Gracilibacillus timonensis]